MLWLWKSKLNLIKLYRTKVAQTKPKFKISKNLGENQILVEKNFGQKKFGKQKFLSEKVFGQKKIFAQKICLV